MLPLLGMTAEPSDTALMVSEFGDLLYMRDFGIQKGAYLPPHGAGKWLYLPPRAVMHVSWKGNVEDLTVWLDGLARPIFLTYWHEPMGNIDPAVYRARATRMVEIVAGHRNRDLVLGNGPIVTRYWLDRSGDPDLWCYDGMTFFGGDCYNGVGATTYRTGEQMFGSTARAAAARGMPWMAPEYGIALVPDDDGTGRAAAMDTGARWAQAEGNCLAVGWWGLGGNRIIGYPAETAVWRDLMAPQAQEETVTVAKPKHLEARALLIEHLNRQPGSGPASDLDPEEVGIVGGPAHVAAGISYHLGKDQLQLSKRPYSVYESPRDQAGLSNYASAMDIGSFSVTVNGQTHNLRTFSLWLVDQCKAGTADTQDIREIIYSPDGVVVKRWDRLGIRTSGDDSHLWHTHLSEFRDATGARMLALFRRYLTEIGVIDMAITSDDVNMIWGDGWEIPGRTPGRTGAGSMEALLTWVQDLRTKTDMLLDKAADDETRDTAHAAALQALADQIAAGGGSVDVAAILARIDEKAAETNTAVEAMRAAHQAELDQLQAENEALRVALAAVPDAVVDEQHTRLQD